MDYPTMLSLQAISSQNKLENGRGECDGMLTILYLYAIFIIITATVATTKCDCN